MPWKEIGIVEKRRQFVEQWLAQEWTMTELCERDGISRQARYNTLACYQQWGGEESQPRSGARIKPTAQAVGPEQNENKPQRGRKRQRHRT